MYLDPHSVNYLSSPLGLIEINASQEALVSLFFVQEKRSPEIYTPLLERACAQLQEYFTGARKVFDLPIFANGTAFQRAVWNELLKIHYGQTVSYQQVAVAISNPKAMRAVGAANGRNPISIIIPCHRVIGADGSLTGYGGSLWRKEWLLDHERQNSK